MYARRLRQHRTIWWLCDDDDSSQPLSFFAGLEKESQRRVQERIDRADANGPSTSDRIFKYVKDGLWEFKLSARGCQIVRLYTMRTSRGYVILYGAHKPNKKTQQADIARALELKQRYLDEGEHYA